MIPKVYLNPKLSLYERRRQLIAVLYERQSDTVGNLAFEFNVSSHTIRNDIRILELEYPIYTKDRCGWRSVHTGFESLAAAMADSTSAGTSDGCVQCFG